MILSRYALCLTACAGWLFATCAAAATPAIGIDWHLTAAQVDARCHASVEAATSRVRAIASPASAAETALSRLLRIEGAVAELQDALVAPLLFANIASDDALRATSVRCNDALATFSATLAADTDIYGLAHAAEGHAATAAERQLARIYVENGRRAGAALPAPQRSRLTRLTVRLGALQDAFMQALGTDHSTIVLDAPGTAGLPADLVATFARVDGGYRVPVTLEGYERFMKNAASGAARKRYLDTFYRIGGAENTRRVRQAVVLRKRIAQLLGFASWADYRLATKMAKTPQRARALLDDIDRELLPRAREEIARLAAMKAASGDRSPFAAWDYAWWEEQYERTQFAVDSEAVRRYFPADKVVPEMLDLYQHLLGVRFERIEPADAWAPDVQEYAIHDAGDERLLGWFYLDLVPRAGKSLPPSNAPLRAGHLLADGRYRLPISSVIGNGPAAEPGQPALYSHRDLVILFHEFGHLMHTTLSTAPYATLYGANVRGDFVEAPSQMLENWMWQPAILKKLSRNVDSGESIPDALIEKMIALKYAADGVFWTRQVFLARYDLALHGPRPPADPDRLWFELMPQLTPLPPMRGTLPSASFLPIMGGYDAGYYGYAWSRVYAQDMFSAFEQGGIDNPQVGMRYRRAILEPGGTREPDELVRDFLGRASNADAFHRDLRIRH